jgi:predicted nuclease of predicted toxin-antitoxin system
LSLLLDENLSPRLILHLAALFPGLTHVRDVGLKQAGDREIREWARRNSYTVVSADADFRRAIPGDQVFATICARHADRLKKRREPQD